MADNITNEYRTLIAELGYESSVSDSGFVRGEALRQKQSAGDGLDDRRFRYASILDPTKLGVTDVFEINGAPCIYLKSLSAEPNAEQIRDWHRTAWNHGLGRMLWIVTPTHIRILNAFEPPPKSDDGKKHPAEILNCVVNDLELLRRYELDRISIESGQFWTTKAGKKISKDTRIDAALAKDLHDAADILTERGCKPLQAHRLMLRTLFTAYLEARGVLSSDLFDGLIGKSFGEVLSRVGETRTFFERMRETFNGDLFPPPPTADEEDETYSLTREQLGVARAIVTRQDLRSGQKTFDFGRYDFEVIPIELISSIYERFIYADDESTAKARGTHYTPVNLVDLVFSQVLDDHLFSKKLPSDAKVLDLACGSGVFLVDAFRRLVARRISAGEKLTRTLVRDVLANQVFGVDINETAIEIAAFSLCLTAFELDPSPGSAQHLKFRHSLKGRNLFVDDAFSTNGFTTHEAFKAKPFSVVVGNPPWNKPKGGRSTFESSSRSHIEYCEKYCPPIDLPFRSPIDQAFIWRSRDFLHAGGRIGLILDAKNFFSQEKQTLISKRQLFTTIRSRAMLNLSVLHNKKLFPSAEQPAMIYIAENGTPQRDDKLVFASAERTETFSRHGIVELYFDHLNHLPVSRISDEPYLFKIASYGTARDRAILRELHANHRSAADVLSSWNTAINTGFKRTPSTTPVPAELVGKPMLEARQLERFRQTTQGLSPFLYETMEHARDPEIYKAPLFLAQQSLQDDRLVGATCSDELVYSRSYFGIPLPRTEGWLLDLVNAYINSSLATYCFFMTATRFGIDKQIAEQNDFERLPFKVAESKSAINALLDAFRTAEESNEVSFESLDEAIFEYYALPKWQREYITDTIQYELNFVRHGSSGPAAQPADDDELMAYAGTVVKSIRSNLEAGSVFVNADIVVNHGDVCCVVIQFNESRNRGVRVVKTEASTNSHLAELLHAPLTSTTQLRRSLIRFDSDRCIIVKLNQKRFWSRARAYDDADVIFDELMRGGD